MVRLSARQLRLSVVLLAVLVLLIFLHYLKITAPVENLVVKIISPIQSRVYGVGVKLKGIYGQSNLQRDLSSANAVLEEEVKQLTIANAQLKVILEENFQIKNQVDFLASRGLEAVTARVIGKGFSPDNQVLILDQGSESGIQIDLPVIAQDGLIIGKVLSVDGVSTKVLLINDSQSSLAVTIQNQIQTKGVVVGEHGLSLKMELIPENEDVQIGDVVITSGLEVNIPRGLIVGQVERLESEPNSFFKAAYLQPLVNFDDLTVVSVLKAPK